MQKSREALADARRSIWKRIKNKQWTYCSSFIWETWFYSLVPFFCFLIRSFNSFCSYFYYCNWPESFHHHAYSRHHANKEWLIFPFTKLIPGSTSIREGRVFTFFLCIDLFDVKDFKRNLTDGNLIRKRILKRIWWCSFLG